MQKFQVINHCPAYIRDKRQLHWLSCLRLGKAEFFLRPVEVLKAQVFDIRAAQSLTIRNQDDGIVPSAFRASPVDGLNQLSQFFMRPDGRDGSLLSGFYHGHLCRKVIRHDAFLVQKTEKGIQGTDILLYCFVGKTCQRPDISINRIQSDCCEIIHPLCGQVIHQIRRLLHIMLCSYPGIAFFSQKIWKRLRISTKNESFRRFSKGMRPVLRCLCCPLLPLLCSLRLADIPR